MNAVRTLTTTRDPLTALGADELARRLRTAETALRTIRSRTDHQTDEFVRESLQKGDLGERYGAFVALGSIEALAEQALRELSHD